MRALSESSNELSLEMKRRDGDELRQLGKRKWSRLAFEKLIDLLIAQTPFAHVKDCIFAKPRFT